MEVLSPPSTITFNKTPSPPPSSSFIKLPILPKTQQRKTFLSLPLSPCYCISSSSIKTNASSASTNTLSLTSYNTSTSAQQRYWTVAMEPPPHENIASSKQEFVNYCVKTLEKVLGSEKDAQMCIYDVSCDAHFGFCCDIDEEISHELASVPGVLSVKPDLDYNSETRNNSSPEIQSDNLSYPLSGSLNLFPAGSTKHWLVRMDKPTIGVVSKAQMVDHYVQILTKVMGNESDAQMCIYHISWKSNFGFCCELDDQCARELVGVPGVLSIQPDEHFDSENKDYGDNLQSPSTLLDSPEESQTTNVKTKKLFVTGLSFYTSEKTLRAAFEGFGELVEVKIIMDKISKRSKGYAFIEYTTEEAASAALKEMNGKIINGWMIVVDVAKPIPPRYSRGRPRPTV